MKTGKLVALFFLLKQKLNICQQGEHCEEIKCKESTGVLGLRTGVAVGSMNWVGNASTVG